MAYWHMHLHPHDKDKWEYTEEELLEKMSLIGIGVKSTSKYLSIFKNEIKLNDIIFIRDKAKPIALVQVIGNFEDKRKNDYSMLDWFRYRRKIKILSIAKSTTELFPRSPSLLLQKSDSENTSTYKYIDDWYKKVRSRDNSIYHLSKIKKVYIKDHKMLHNLTLDLNNSESIPLPIIVIAGKNGTGKTTLLEYLAKYNADSENDYLEILRVAIGGDTMSSKMQKGEVGIIDTREEYRNSIKYMKVEVNSIGDIEEYIADYYIDLATEYDSFKKALKEVQNFISDAFEGLQLDFNVVKINYKEKKVFFTKNDSLVEFTVDALSTGEKTLLSKVLSLFFEKVKNKIILIDEPELSLHPSWQNKVLKIYENFAKKNNCQIIIATHSPHIIGSAKNEYLRILRKNEKGNIEVVDDSMAYGRDIEWVLEEVMGTPYTREKKIVEKIEACQSLIDEEQYDEADKAIDALEEIIGENDSEVLTLRNSLAFERMDFEEDN